MTSLLGERRHHGGVDALGERRHHGGVDALGDDVRIDRGEVRPRAGRDEGRPRAGRGTETISTGMVDRVGWSMACVLLALAAIQAWSGSLLIPSDNVASVVLIGIALVGIWRCWMSTDGPSTRLQLTILAGIAIAMGYYAVQIWMGNPQYGTDAVAFDQYAAQLALHGHDPYTHSMEPSFALYHVPVIFHTYRLNGTAVTDLSYPAGSFLFYVPLLAAGVTAQAANIVDLFAWYVAMLLLWRFLPRGTRWSVPVLMCGQTYLLFIFGGVTDTLFLPFLMLACYRWDRYADPRNPTWTRWAGPIALGVAMSVKQTPWFVLPFLCVGVAIEAYFRRQSPTRIGLRYLGTAVGTFLLINLPFILPSPAAWTRGALTPLVEPTIADGQGLVDLTLFEHWGGSHLSWFSAAGAVFVLFALGLMVTRYPTMKRTWLTLVPISFFLATRSFGSYLIMMLPVVAVGALSVGRGRSVPIARFRRPISGVLAGLLGATALALAVALVSPSPLGLRIINVRSTGQLQSINQITVRATNRTDRSVEPHFTVNSANHVTTFWYAVHGTRAYTPRLAPHETSTIVLDVPNAESEPGLTSPFDLDAFTSSPAAVSIASSFSVGTDSLYVTPADIDGPIKVGRSLHFTVQVQNQLGEPVAMAGLRVLLGQVVYTEANQLPGEMSINGAPEGESPVAATTNSRGTASFTVVEMQPQSVPVDLEAWIEGGDGVPHGYSNQVLLQFTPSR